MVTISNNYFLKLKLSAPLNIILFCRNTALNTTSTTTSLFFALHLQLYSKTLPKQCALMFSSSLSAMERMTNTIIGRNFFTPGLS